MADLHGHRVDCFFLQCNSPEFVLFLSIVVHRRNFDTFSGILLRSYASHHQGHNGHRGRGNLHSSPCPSHSLRTSTARAAKLPSQPIPSAQIVLHDACLAGSLPVARCGALSIRLSRLFWGVSHSHPLPEMVIMALCLPLQVVSAVERNEPARPWGFTPP
jgi:hypothetical protein